MWPSKSDDSKTHQEPTSWIPIKYRILGVVCGKSMDKKHILTWQDKTREIIGRPLPNTPTLKEQIL